jgi:predicted transglutaminase-like cysteine proteinase
MGKAEIIADLGAGQYTIKRVYSGREAAQDKIVLLNTNITELQSQYSLMPETTEDEIFAKHITKLQITSLQKQVEYIEKNFPADIEVDAYCADYTEDLSGEVGTIDIPGEVTEQVNILPGYGETAAFDAERDGEFWPSIAVGPWTCFLNKCILPGWQKWYPKYRYGWIVPGSINYDDNTCAVTIQPAFSSQQNLDVNEGDGFGGAIVDEEIELEYFKQDAATANPGFLDFCERNPGHPICNVSELAPPVEISDEQWQALSDINVAVDYFYSYENDQSGYEVGDYWNPMYDLGDTWVDYGATFPDGRPIVGPPITRPGDCEDYVLTKMQAIIEKGIVPAENLQVILCYVDGGYHAVMGIQTTNRGFLIMDQREYGAILDKSVLDRTHQWESFSVAGTIWATVQRLKGEVPIEYMDCNAAAFMDSDAVVIEFQGQDWDDPKVIGFADVPVECGFKLLFTFGLGLTVGPNYSHQYATYYDPILDAWAYAAGDGPRRYARQMAQASRNSVTILVTGGYVLADSFPELPFTASCPSNQYVCGTSNLTLNDADLFFMPGGTFSAAINVPGQRRGLHGVFCINGEHFVCGGSGYPHGHPCCKTGLPFSSNYDWGVRSSTYKFNEVAGAWSSQVSLPVALWGIANFVIDNEGYLIGGQASELNDPLGYWTDSSMSAAVRKYSPITETWISSASLPVARWQSSGFEAFGLGYVTTGMVENQLHTDDLYVTISGWGQWTTVNTVQYDPVTNLWAMVAAKQYTIFYSCGAGLQDKGHSLTPLGSGGNDHEIYDPLTNSWEVKAKHIHPSPDFWQCAA